MRMMLLNFTLMSQVHPGLSESSNEVDVVCTRESGGQKCAFILFSEVFVPRQRVAENEIPSLFPTHIWCDASKMRKLFVSLEGKSSL